MERIEHFYNQRTNQIVAVMGVLEHYALVGYFAYHYLLVPFDEETKNRFFEDFEYFKYAEIGLATLLFFFCMWQSVKRSLAHVIASAIWIVMFLSHFLSISVLAPFFIIYDTMKLPFLFISSCVGIVASYWALTDLMMASRPNFADMRKYLMFKGWLLLLILSVGALCYGTIALFEKQSPVVNGLATGLAASQLGLIAILLRKSREDAYKVPDHN